MFLLDLQTFTSREKKICYVKLSTENRFSTFFSVLMWKKIQITPEECFACLLCFAKEIQVQILQEISLFNDFVLRDIA